MLETEVTDVSYVDTAPGESSNHPCCPHGPTLLFNRQSRTGSRKYYACSACRDRRLCRFFHWADEKYSEETKKSWELEQKKFVGKRSHEEIYETLHSLKPYISEKEVAYCHLCSKFFLHASAEDHSGHDILLNVTPYQIAHPTELLKPAECKKKEAQYFFSKASIQVLIDMVQNCGIKSVICIGSPRVHQYIKTENLNIGSILLDFDKRFLMFYKPEEFCWFNAFNFHFFFGEASKQSLINFLLHTEGEGLVLILDPPFGGRLEPLVHTIRNIETLYKQQYPYIKNDIQVILINPYYMEHHVINCFPTLRMIDYKVTYDNHPLFSQGTKARKLGSPIRIFTNISPMNVILPVEEGYKFCKICSCWVSPENIHCKYCNKCTSKNGSTYVHCKKCQKCVKPSWKHCEKCRQCCVKIHDCTSFAATTKCYQCGEEGHKQKNCVDFKESVTIPVVNVSNSNYKRRAGIFGNKFKRKKVGKSN